MGPRILGPTFQTKVKRLLHYGPPPFPVKPIDMNPVPPRIIPWSPSRPTNFSQFRCSTISNLWHILLAMQRVNQVLNLMWAGMGTSFHGNDWRQRGSHPSCPVRVSFNRDRTRPFMICAAQFGGPCIFKQVLFDCDGDRSMMPWEGLLGVQQGRMDLDATRSYK